ncbi:hypothetical protein [Planctomicrobium sp. SH527]|uniref:hypothetical protein n=1 Tax=Planctomicrobium sp. SH527 TaxID=3448123 RepID=UPI003F5C8262
MSGWFSKTKDLFQRGQPESPQPFGLTCECGQEHTGLRRQRQQELQCKSCGRSIFVLPRNVYPIPVAPVEKSPSTNKKEDDDFGPGPQSISKLKKRTRSTPDSAAPEQPRPKAPKQKSATTRPVAAPLAKAEVRSQTPQGKVKIPKNKIQIPTRPSFWKRFLGFGIAVTVIALFTMFWILRQAQFANAAAVASAAGKQGLELFEEGKWLDARSPLESATIALNRLGRSDPDAQAIRYAFYESRAMTHLCADSIDEIFQQAVQKFNEQKQPAKIKNRLADRHLNQWLVVEAVVEDVTPEKSRRRRFEVKLPMHGNGITGNAILEVNFPDFAKAVPKGGKLECIFAGAIADCERDEKQDCWILKLDPETGFLWVHPRTYADLGFDFSLASPEDAIVQRLEQQAKIVGCEP